MTVKELKDKLNDFPDDMAVWWVDVIEGNDDTVESVYEGQDPYGADTDKVVFISPSYAPRCKLNDKP